MSKLLKWTGDVNKALKTVNARMETEGFEFATWENAYTGARFVASSDTVKRMYLNKFEGGADVNDSEIVRISSTSLTVNEMREAGHGATIKEGFDGKEETKIDLSKIDILEQVLYNTDFDCSILFN